MLEIPSNWREWLLDDIEIVSQRGGVVVIEVKDKALGIAKTGHRLMLIEDALRERLGIEFGGLDVQSLEKTDTNSKRDGRLEDRP